MSATRIDGHVISAEVKAGVAEAVAGLPGKPCLAVVLVGEDPASQVYVRNKGKATVEAGMESRHLCCRRQRRRPRWRR